MDRAFNRTFDGRNSSFRGRGRGGSPRGSGARQSFVGGRMRSSGRFAQGSLRVNSRPSASIISKSVRGARTFPWKQDLFEDSLAAAGLSPMESETKLHVSNLDIGVSSDDIRDIFATVGELNRYALHYNKDGLPSGSAEVVYMKRSDAFAAVKRYNNAKLDGRHLKVEVISPTPAVPVSARVNVTGSRVNGAAVRRVVIRPGSGDRLKPMGRSNQGAFSGPFSQRGRGGMRNSMRGRGRGSGRSQPQLQSNNRGGGNRYRKKQQPKEKSAAELDMELDKYHAEAMETS